MAELDTTHVLPSPFRELNKAVCKCEWHIYKDVNWLDAYEALIKAVSMLPNMPLTTGNEELKSRYESILDRIKRCSNEIWDYFDEIEE